MRCYRQFNHKLIKSCEVLLKTCKLSLVKNCHSERSEASQIRWDAPEEGGFAYQVIPVRSHKHGTQINADDADFFELKFGNGQINFGRIRTGDWVWRTHDPELGKAAKPFTQASQPVMKRPLSIHAIAHEGQPLQLVWTLNEQPHIIATVQSPEPLPAARNQALNLDFAGDQLGRLGNTPYELAHLTLNVNGRPFAPASLLNALRREAVEKLKALQSTPTTTHLNDPTAILNRRQSVCPQRLFVPASSEFA